MPPWAGQQKCDICGNLFANSKSLKKHIQSVHNKFKPFICNICGHKTTRKAMLDVKDLIEKTGQIILIIFLLVVVTPATTHWRKTAQMYEMRL